MISTKMIVWIVGLSAVTYIGIQKYAAKAG